MEYTKASKYTVSKHSQMPRRRVSQDTVQIPRKSRWVCLTKENPFLGNDSPRPLLVCEADYLLLMLLYDTFAQCTV